MLNPVLDIGSHLKKLVMLILIVAGLSVSVVTVYAKDDARPQPNIVLIMTDDQGYGDLGAHGNPKIRTPVLDAFTSESLYVPEFYVCPVCSPTRASLMTGRYNYRTGIVDTWLGRSMMHADEVTVAEVLAEAGYRTGIFGKWHLGDNYPMRPQDQGFQEVLVHGGGGITQPGDVPGNTYFDPVLSHNGTDKTYKGYCSDIFTDGTIDFVKQSSEKPFFAYLSFNCPHTPLQVPDEELAPYLKMDLSKEQFPQNGFPIAGQIPHEDTARVYAMVTNIDTNLGRLFKALEESGKADNTLVIFITDNGPQQVRYNFGLRGRKGNVYEGGIRVPCYIRWPGQLEKGTYQGPPLAHIDLPPTMLAAGNVPLPEGLKIDGVNALPFLQGKDETLDRTLYFQWHRGDEPEPFRAFAARGPRYKLVQSAGVAPGSMPKVPSFQLFDISKDPYEMKNLAAEHPDIVDKMKQEYLAWFRDVSSTRGYDPPRIYLGHDRENPTTLTRQDWRGPNAGWAPNSVGYWEVSVRQAGAYQVTLRFRPSNSEEKAVLSIGELSWTKEIPKGASDVTIDIPKLDTGDVRLTATVDDGKNQRGVSYVDVKRD